MIAGDDLYDIKFFPYATQDDEQVFAVTGGKDVSFTSTLRVPYNPTD